jgi:hypothetical protein
MSEPQTNVIPLGNATAGNARKAQMVEHFARKLDAILATSATEFSAAFVIYGHQGDSVSHVVSWDVADEIKIPTRMIVDDASALLADKAAKMRAGEPT